MADFGRLRKQLAIHEASRTTVYDDATGKPIGPGTVVKGYPTIGVGRNVYHKGLLEDEVQYLLDNDLAEVAATASKFAWFDKLDHVRQNVVLELLFNLGETRFRGFKKFIRYMSEHRFPHAAAELKDSAWYSQVGKRADVLIKMVATGEWPQ